MSHLRKRMSSTDAEIDSCDGRLVSVIIPVFDTELYLPQCLNSVLGQSHALLEVIVVDDGSRDSSLDILKEYAMRDDRIKVLSQKNGGQGAARNRALALASGEWISFVDSDDYLHPRYFERLLEKAVTRHADFAVCAAVQFEDLTGESIGCDPLSSIGFSVAIDDLGFQPSVHNSKKDLLRVNTHPWAKLFREELARPLHFPTNIRLGEDHPFVYEALMKSHRVVVLREQLYYRRRRDGSITGRFLMGYQPVAAFEDYMSVRGLCLDIFMCDAGLAELYEQSSADQLWYFFSRIPEDLRLAHEEVVRNALGQEAARFFAPAELERQKALELEHQKTLELERQKALELEHQKALKLQRDYESLVSSRAYRLSVIIRAIWSSIRRIGKLFQFWNP